MNCPNCKVGYIRVIDFYGADSTELICDKCLKCFEKTGARTIEFSEVITEYCRSLDYRGILNKRVRGYPMFVPDRN